MNEMFDMAGMELPSFLGKTKEENLEVSPQTSTDFKEPKVQ